MKFEEWEKYFNMLLSKDEEVQFLAAELLNKEKDRLGIILPIDNSISPDFFLYYSLVILGTIAWMEQYPECTFYRYIYSSKKVRVHYKGKEIAVVSK